MSQADKQIADTKKHLDIPNAGGILIILNERSGRTLPHDVLGGMIDHFEADNAEERRFANVNGVMLSQRLQDFTIRGSKAVSIYMQTKYPHAGANDFGVFLGTAWGHSKPISGFFPDLPYPDRP